MSGFGSLQTFRKQDPAAAPGPPFAAASADNGVSVDAVSGRIVLGNDDGTGVGGSAAFLNTREIDVAGFVLRLLNGSGIVELAGGFIVISDTASNNPRLFFDNFVIGQGGGNFYIGDQVTPIMLELFTTGNFVLGATGVDNGQRLQVDGHISMRTATANLNFPNTAAQTSADLTIALADAVVGDMVTLGFDPAAAVANSCYTAFVDSAGSVTVRFNNYSAGAIDPPAADFTVSILKPL